MHTRATRLRWCRLLKGMLDNPSQRIMWDDLDYVRKAVAECIEWGENPLPYGYPRILRQTSWRDIDIRLFRIQASYWEVDRADTVEISRDRLLLSLISKLKRIK